MSSPPESPDLAKGAGVRYLAAIFPLDLRVNGDGDPIAVEPVALIPAEIATPYLAKFSVAVCQEVASIVNQKDIALCDYYYSLISCRNCWGRFDEFAVYLFSDDTGRVR